MTAWRRRYTPSTPKESRAGEALPSPPLPAPAWLAGHEVHTLGKSKSKRLGSREIRGLGEGTLLRGSASVAGRVSQGSLGLSEPQLPQLQETPGKVQSPLRNTGPPVFSLRWAGCLLSAPEPSRCHHRKGSTKAVALGLQQVPRPIGLKGA